MACILLEYRHFSVHPIHEFESIVISISHARQETIAVLAGQLLVSASNFMTGILLARSLGPEGYGRYALAMGTMLFLGSIQTALIISPMMVKGPGRAEGAGKGHYRFLHRSQLLFAVAACSLTLIAQESVSVAFSEWNIAPLFRFCPWPQLPFAPARRNSHAACSLFSAALSQHWAMISPHMAFAWACCGYYSSQAR